MVTRVGGVTLDNTGARRIALRVVVWQAAAAISIAAMFLAFATRTAGLSALLGGGIGVAASLAMFIVAFRRSAATEAKQIVGAFYRGEAAKLLLTVVLFVVVLSLVEVEVLAFFGGYAGTLLVYWLALVRN
jgi:ATP synthase protein I